MQTVIFLAFLNVIYMCKQNRAVRGSQGLDAYARDWNVASQ